MPTPQEHLSEAAKLIRSFNDVSRTITTGWQHPDDAHAALGSLTAIAQMLPRAIEQSVRPITHAHSNGQLLTSEGSPSESVRALRAFLDEAIQHAADLTKIVAALHIETNDLKSPPAQAGADSGR
ncbi:hypothetical protein ABT282_07640 [Streptomyces sp. NPDC000927]|uniref:hypothetical protein n=1 Tax=Streptomyces sp. NPDC000927 TaxID=3154371 RepID=UPI00332B85F3